MTLFLTLRVFSATGGIEKVCRIAGKAMYELGLQFGGGVKVYSMHGHADSAIGNKYFPQFVFTGFNGNKVRCVLKSIKEGRRSRVVLLSHINLLLPGFLIKFFSPRVKLVLLAHGIEVWKPLPKWKLFMLKKFDLILPVSHFTKERMKELYGLPEERFKVLNNCLDPFMEFPLQESKDEDLLDKYGLNIDHQVMLTVSRLSTTEQYKGYDKVLTALPSLTKMYPDLRYLVVGKYDVEEKIRLDRMVQDLGLEDIVIFTGFVPDEDLAAHFRLADLFVMPSEKEGFGIVFIEAMFYGIPVIAGNLDGSVDALSNGRLGTLINPEKKSELISAIRNMLDHPSTHTPNRELLMKEFSYQTYKRGLGEVVGRA